MNKFFSFGSFTTFYSVNSVISSHLYVTRRFQFQPRQSNMIFSPQGQRHITLTGSDQLLCLLSSENNSTYLMSLHILWVLCECELLKLRKCVTRKVLRPSMPTKDPFFSHIHVNAGWNLNKICCEDESLSWEGMFGLANKKYTFQWSTAAAHKLNHATKHALKYYLTLTAGSIIQRNIISNWN